MLTWRKAPWVTEPYAEVESPLYSYLPYRGSSREYIDLPRESIPVLLGALEKLLGGVIDVLKLLSQTYIRYYNAEKSLQQ